MKSKASSKTSISISPRDLVLRFTSTVKKMKSNGPKSKYSRLKNVLGKINGAFDLRWQNVNITVMDIVLLQIKDPQQAQVIAGHMYQVVEYFERGDETGEWRN